jgi:hypothetical protein
VDSSRDDDSQQLMTQHRQPQHVHTDHITSSAADYLLLVLVTAMCTMEAV